MTPVANAPQLPSHIGKYTIRRKLGQGGMSTVYLAYDSFANQEVALKAANFNQLDTQYYDQEQFKKLFFNEAHTAGMLDHPNVVKIFDADFSDDYYYIAMEYIPEGKTVKEYCAPDRLLPVFDAVNIIYKMAKALDYAHRQGIVHRDVKPGNILLTPDNDVKLTDFGIAMINTPEASQTQFTGLMGSPLYMSPEQINQEVVSCATDIFSLGIVAFELLIGHHPFRASSLPAISHRITTEQPPSLRSYRPELSKHLDYIVHRMLRKNPADRYATGLDLAADLTVIFNNLEQGDYPYAQLERKRFEIIKNLAFFENFTDADIWELIRSALWLDRPMGTVIVKEGELDSCFYILLSGLVAVQKNDKRIDRLQAGSCFGEMGYLAKTRRTADIVAISNVTLLKINASILERANAECQLRFLKAFVKTLITRLSDTTAALARMV